MEELERTRTIWFEADGQPCALLIHCACGAYVWRPPGAPGCEDCHPMPRAKR